MSEDMALQQIAAKREEAEIYHDTAICKKKSMEILGEYHLPKGLLPLNDIIEVGYNRTTGFVWLKQQKKSEHKFKAIGKTVSYEAEVTAFIEDRRMLRLSGVRSKELLIWVNISDISVNENNSKISFANPTGLSRTFPVSAFEPEEEEKK